MPSPVGHLIAGATVALASHPRQTSTGWPRLVVAAALLAAAPDLDLLVPGAHRTFTHSYAAALLVGLAAAAASRARAGRVDWRLTFVCTLAYGSHLLTDYFGVDHGTPAGIQLYWPWSDRYYISPWSVFLATERYDPFSAFAMTMNALAISRELLVLGPILLLGLVRSRRMARPRARAHGRQPDDATPSSSGADPADVVGADG